MKKIFSTIILILILSGFYTTTTTASGSSFFRVTAYYSPLPNQEYYIKGNYHSEIRMNWRGIRWTSWKLVFSGMLAAPRKYSFGTKIYLKWLWIWEVADRWWAIVKAWKRNFKYDRIDIWVWYWDEWLRRAMYWGNRVIKWNIVKRSNKVSINYKKIYSPYWVTGKLDKNIIKHNSSKKTKIKTEFDLLLEKELEIFQNKINNNKQTRILQKRLSDLWLYWWKIDWNYNNIISIIIKYQLEKKLIRFKWSTWAWYFWPKTRKSLKGDYKKYLIDEKEKQNKINLFKINAEKKATKKLNEIWNITFWNISPNVRELQKTLKKLWYFYNKDTAIFWKKTKQAILDYQLDKKVIANSYVLWAGVFWPNTKKQLRNDLANIYLLEIISKNIELVKYYQNKKNKVAKQREQIKKV
jgi:hypothetical protein